MAWLPASFNHDNITGSCGSCHNGTSATGKNTGHFVTARDCVECHTTTVWTPSTFVHTTGNYPGDHRAALACTDCHGGNTEAVTWRSAAYQPDCAGCHSNRFSPGDHPNKIQTPQTRYTVSELRDCSGPCHTYTDATMTVIASRHNAQHRVSDGGF